MAASLEEKTRLLHEEPAIINRERTSFSVSVWGAIVGVLACTCVTFAVVSHGATRMSLIAGLGDELAEPGAAEPQPEAAEPQQPQPEAAEPQPEAAEPQPEAAEPQPEAAQPQSEAAEPQPEAAEPQPQPTAAEPQPEAAEPQLEKQGDPPDGALEQADVVRAPEDMRPFIVDIPSASPLFKFQAFSYACEKKYALSEKIREKGGVPSESEILQLTGGNEEYKACFSAHFSSPVDAGQPLTERDWSLHRGMMIGVFRAPGARIAEGFVNNFESCPRMRKEYGIRCDPTRRDHQPGDCIAAYSPSPANVRRYFECVRGCTVNLLNGISCGGTSPTCEGASMSLLQAAPQVCDNHVPTDEEVEAAVAHITDGSFAVIGIAEHYAETVRRLKAVIMHQAVAAKVGGEAAMRVEARRAAALGDDERNKVATLSLEEELAPFVRESADKPQATQEAEQKVAEMLRDFNLKDEADTKLYEAAVKMFASTKGPGKLVPDGWEEETTEPNEEEPSQKDEEEEGSPEEPNEEALPDEPKEETPNAEDEVKQDAPTEETQVVPVEDGQSTR